MQCNQSFCTGFPNCCPNPNQFYPNPHLPNTMLQCNGVPYPEIVGEGEVSSIMLPDGSMQLYFQPTMKWCPPFTQHPNLMSYNNPYLNTNTAWFVRNISSLNSLNPFGSSVIPCGNLVNPFGNPVNPFGNAVLPPLFNQQNQIPCGASLPLTRPCFGCNSSSGLPTPAPRIKFHNDGWTSTTDLTYFYPRTRSCNLITKACTGVQVSVPDEKNGHCDVVCKKPCNSNCYQEHTGCTIDLSSSHGDVKDKSNICECYSKSNKKELSSQSYMSIDGEKPKKKSSRKLKAKKKIKEKRRERVVCECFSPIHSKRIVIASSESSMSIDGTKSKALSKKDKVKKERRKNKDQSQEDLCSCCATAASTDSRTSTERNKRKPKRDKKKEKKSNHVCECFSQSESKNSSQSEVTKNKSFSYCRNRTKTKSNKDKPEKSVCECFSQSESNGSSQSGAEVHKNKSCSYFRNRTKTNSNKDKPEKNNHSCECFSQSESHSSHSCMSVAEKKSKPSEYLTAGSSRTEGKRKNKKITKKMKKKNHLCKCPLSLESKESTQCCKTRLQKKSFFCSFGNSEDEVMKDDGYACGMQVETSNKQVATYTNQASCCNAESLCGSKNSQNSCGNTSPIVQNPMSACGLPALWNLVTKLCDSNTKVTNVEIWRPKMPKSKKALEEHSNMSLIS